MKRIMLLGALIFSAAFVEGRHTAGSVQKQLARAQQYLRSGNEDRAIRLYEDILVKGPHADAYYQLATIYSARGRYDIATSYYEALLRLDPRYPNALIRAAESYVQTDKKDLAIKTYTKVLETDSRNVGCLTSLATLYRDGEAFDEVLKVCNQALEVESKNTEMLFMAAQALNILQRPEEALACYRKIEEVTPNNLKMLHNTAYTLRRLNRIDESVDYFDRAIELAPQAAESRLGLGLTLLSVGNQFTDVWSEGWENYEYRLKVYKNSDYPHYPIPVWDGSDLKGKTLLMWAEQGLGDTFQFIRYAQSAKDAGAARVVVAVQNPLVDIAKHCPYIDEVIRLKDNAPSCDYQISIVSMPHRMKTDLQTIPNRIPYLFADETLIEAWKNRLSEDKNFKIGICWHSNPEYGTALTKMVSASRNVPLLDFLPIMQVPGITVYNLQQMYGLDQLADLASDLPFVTFGQDFDKTNGRFMDTAAVMKNLDLVITVDTSICHLAGGLGVPTWTLLANVPDWRWMLEGDTSPWYPTMRLFRQSERNDWKAVIAEVVDLLKAHLQDNVPLI